MAYYYTLPYMGEHLIKRRINMKIIIDEVKKDGVLVKNDGTEISRYSYKNLVNKEFTLEDFKKEIENFNITVGQQEEFDNIKELSKSSKIHNW